MRLVLLLFDESHFCLFVCFYISRPLTKKGIYLYYTLTEKPFFKVWVDVIKKKKIIAEKLDLYSHLLTGKGFFVYVSKSLRDYGIGL